MTASLCLKACNLIRLTFGSIVIIIDMSVLRSELRHTRETMPGAHLPIEIKSISGGNTVADGNQPSLDDLM